ncbi:condensation domain-containing protein [Kitasatospora sp. NPDC048722]|uniref:condensation domain-containing protein n=1 Tax=Kitasatospora sp. NPDC048722 TaxID=3155639 RepID=UPI00340AE92B
MPQLTVDFAGARPARSGPLSFGHANIVRAISIDDDPTRLNLAMVFGVPADGGPDRIAAQLRTLLERHESLRTTYVLTTPPTQRVAASGTLVVELVESDGDPLGTAERTARRLRARPFDLQSELPFRAAVVTADGVPRQLVWVVTHAAMDVAACEVLHAEWAALCAGRELPEPPALEPVDVVELERSASVQRIGAGAVQYWGGQIGRVPQAVFPPPTGTPAKSDWLHPGLAVRSAAAPAQLAAVAERTGASASTVVLAALAVLVGHRTGHGTVAVTSLSGNRVVPKLRGFFGSLAQDALLPLDLDGLTGFDDVVRRVRAAGLPAYRHSWFDPTAVWRAIEAASTERGISFARDLVFNDMSALAAAADSPDESARGRLPGVWIPGHQEPAVPEPGLGGSVGWVPAEDVPCRFFACLYRLAGEFELTLWLDPQTLPGAEAEEFGRALLRLFAAAAEEDVALEELPSLTTLAPVERGPGWYLSDRSWVELAAVRTLLAEVLADTPHLVTAEPDDDLGHRLVCRLAGPADPRDVQRRALAALPGRVSAVTPHRYVVHGGAPEPARADDPQAWAELPVLSDSSGRPAEGDLT